MKKSHGEQGLLDHTHPRELENPFNPDERETAPSLPLVEEAASVSHHGVVREATKRKIGREEEAKLALEHTEISRGTCWILTLAFLGTIFSVPLLQSFLEVRENLSSRQQQAKSQHAITTGVLPHAFDALQELPTRSQIETVSNWRQAWALLPDAERLQTHETTLEEESFLTKWMLPRVSGVLLRAGVGNEHVIVGQRGENHRPWLFYKADVDYLSSQGFLDPVLQSIRERAGDAQNTGVQHDSVRAILDFHKQLAARHIQLVVVPVPVKPMLEAEHLVAEASLKKNEIQNPSYAQWMQSLKNKGVTIFDPTSILQAQKTQTGKSQFLQSDTHWTPQAMQAVAHALSKFLEQKVAFDGARREYSHRRRMAQNPGDIAMMLSLPENQTAVTNQKVRIEPVFDIQEAAWQSDKNAELLLLGDSFSNIYTLAGMGWGEGAGFAPQLSRFLQRPVDSVVVNAGGAYASRQRLIGEMHSNRLRLQNTKVVVWEFSMRDLLSGDWKILTLPPTAKPSGPALRKR